MNVLGKNERSWRKARKRGVSPIIATILLVAITVVLAAVLYVLISGLTHGVGAAPLGTDFGFGPTSNTTVATGGTAATGCTAGDPCYSIDVAGVGGGISTLSVSFILHSPAQALVSFPTGTLIKLISVTTGAVIDTYTVSTGSWSSTQAFADGQTLVVNTEGATSATTGLFGDTMVAVGGSGYSGTVFANPFN